MLNSQYLYDEMIYESQLMEVYTDKEMVEYMLNHGLWTEKEDGELKTASERIDSLKLEMYRQYSAFHSYQMERARKLLNKTKARTSELFTKRHSMDMYTCEGLAATYQLKNLIINNIYKDNGKKVNPRSINDSLSQIILSQYINNRPHDNDLRQLSKIDKWKTIWNSSKNEHSLFGRPAILLTDDQKNLTAWSRLYDSVSECGDSPSKDVIEDDDLFDGWLIDYHKKQEQAKKENKDDGRMPGAQEVFIMAESPEDVQRINEMNTDDAQFTKKQRFSIIKKFGAMAEENMPDSKQQMVMQATQQFRQSMKRS